MAENNALSYYGHEIAPGAFVRQQRSNGAIHGGKLSFLMHRESQQIGIRDLLVAHEASNEWFKRLDQAHLTGPELVSRMAKVGIEQRKGIGFGKKKDVN